MRTRWREGMFFWVVGGCVFIIAMDVCMNLIEWIERLQ